MNRKSRIIFIGIVLCAVMGACALVIYNGGRESEEVLSGMEGEVASAPAILNTWKPKNGKESDGQSAVAIGCDVPEVPERAEIVSWEVRDVVNDQGYLEGILADNPEKKPYKLKPRGANDFHQSKGYPYFYLPYVESQYGFQLRKNTEDGITRSQKFTKKQVLEKVSRVLEHFSLSVEPMERWGVEKNISYEGTYGHRNDCKSKNNYQVKMYQAYGGIPTLDTGGDIYREKKSDSDIVAFQPLEFCYGDAGWLEINLNQCLTMKGTGQYVEVLTLDEASAFLADKVGGYYIAEVKFGYWFGENQTLRPFWYVGGGEYAIEYPYCIDAETGVVYGVEEADFFHIL